MTERLYNLDSFIFDFDATVISCEKEKDHFVTILDRSAFFPEGGGQLGDVGKIGDVKIYDTQEKGGEVLHYSEEYIDPGKYSCSVDRDIRFRRMQNHTGEHIISGIANSLYGCENVGFHLGKDDMTMDYDRELSDEDIKRIEYLANKAVCEDKSITVSYPGPEELSKIDYRSKLELTENVRIVTIEDVDCCACCAPHVKSTGMVGIIKIIDYIRYKGGMRIHAKCGLDALDVLSGYQESIEKISALFSAKRHEVYDFALKFTEDSAKKDREIYLLKSKLLEYQLKDVDLSKNNVCLILEDADTDTMRSAANKITENFGGYCVVLSGNDNNGYRFVLAKKDGGIKSVIKDINSALNGKGGGSDQMATGMYAADRNTIEKFFETL